jgi:hypothetical protein
MKKGAAMKYQEFLELVAKYGSDENERLKLIRVANELFFGPAEIHTCGDEYMVELPGGSICLNCGNHFISFEVD